ncbi:hypothetical protein D1BOALGB6SA_9905 [Olavius sp. associated proteobacterium Delta 1]|nr:hypothetical protein D1BOALGB6SA_9905 [Olavius sp. associated proteobacterium Delta 1]
MSKSKGVENLDSPRNSAEAIDSPDQKVLRSTEKIEPETLDILPPYRKQADSPAALFKSRPADGRTAATGPAEKQLDPATMLLKNQP